MKTAILQCLQQVSSKNSKPFIMKKIIRKFKLQSYCKIEENVRFSL